MITEHHIDLIQESNSLDLKMTTEPRWGPGVTSVIVRIVYKRLFILIPRWWERGVLEARYIIIFIIYVLHYIFIINVLQRAA